MWLHIQAPQPRTFVCAHVHPDTGSAVASIASTMETFWLGTVAVPGDAPTPAEQAQLEAALQAMNCVPVFLDAATARRMYHGFCKTVMWPILHNVDQLDYIHAAWNVKVGLGVGLPGCGQLPGCLGGAVSAPTGLGRPH